MAISTLETSHSQSFKRLAVFVCFLCGFAASCHPATLDAQPSTDHPLARSVVAVSRVTNDTPGDPSDANFIPAALGCGVILHAEGLILTNRHLLGDPNRDQYFIWLPRTDHATNRWHTAALVAADTWSDLAVLKIDVAGLTPVILPTGDHQWQPGDSVTVGHDPRAIIDSGSAELMPGILRDFDQPFLLPAAHEKQFSLMAADSLYQYGGLLRIDTDSPGYTSGGAIVDDSGTLRGLTTAWVPRLPSPNHIAIPANKIFRYAVSQLQQGRVPEYGYLGVTLRDLSASQQQDGLEGVQVTNVVPNSPAELAEIGFADVITHIDGNKVVTVNDAMSIIAGLPAGTSIRVQFIRGAISRQPVEEMDLQITLSRRWVSPRRTSFASQPPFSLAGMQVDFYTAVPNFESIALAADPQGCVVITDVTVDSPAWTAGLRPRQFISRVNGVRISNPAEFHTAANNRLESIVKLEITRGDDDQPQTLTVQVTGGEED
ncbi:MAG: PDZ domain-containing protein [Pirellulaceae bacterium]